MKKVVFLISCVCWLLVLPAQNKVHVSGIVSDEATGEPLIGVTILEKGTTNGTVTGLDGDFMLQVNEGAVIEFSYVGYKTQELPAVDGQPMVVKLGTDAQLMEEVVVVGYQVMKRRDVLGAVAKVEGSQLNKVPVASTQQALQGRISGVQVSTQTGEPGSSISVRVRGVGSISASNEPLYIVDGIPMENGLENISPNDIENISVLKDASSAAIYGSRATNGVVLVTTKNGQAGKARVTYNAQVGFQRHGKLIDMVDTDQYIELYNEAARADNPSAAVPRALIEGDYVQDFANTNWLEEIFRPALLQQHELSVSGGSEKTQYLMSLSYYDQDGIIKNTDYDRVNLRTNLKSDVKDWLQVGLNVNVSSASQRRVSSSGDGAAGEGGSVVRYALFRNPAIPVTDADGNYTDLPGDYYGNSIYNSFFGDGYNPVALTEYTDMTNKVRSLLASGNVTIKLPANLFVKGVFGVDYNSTKARTFNQTWGSNNRINSVNGLDVSETSSANWTTNITLNQSIDVNDLHYINWMVGGEAIRENTEVLGGSASDLGELIYLNYGNQQKNPYQNEYGSSLLSFFGSFNYNYAQKYYVSALLREDGSSRFTKGNRWGTFYSVSAGWNIESEEFMQDVTAINKLKLRAGYGSIGNQNIDLYSNLDRYTGIYYYPFGGTPDYGYIQTALGNPNLHWETSNQFNAGIDLELFRGELGASIDYYYKVTNDMLVRASLPPSTGNASAQWVNNGSVLNTGVDVELFYRKQYKNGGFDITFNGGFLHNEVLSLEAPQLGGLVDSGVYATRTEVGQPIGAFYLYEMDGIFQDEYEILTSAYQGDGIQPGDVKYKDISGPNGVPDGVIDSNDKVFCGSAIPKFTAGLNLSGNYKQWDLSLFFQGAFGQKIYSQVNHDIEGFYRGFGVTQRYYDNRWTPDNPDATQPRASWSAKQNNAKAGTTRFLEDGSYVRLKNVQIGYTIPNTDKIKIDNIRLYLAATNLFTITGYSGLDPEMTVSTNSKSEGDRANGIDWGTYPVAMSFTFGLNITF